MEPELSELCDGHWTTVTPSNATPSSQLTARIHDATSLLPTDYNGGCHIQLAGMPDNERRYWRLPTKIAPILTYLLYSVSNVIESNIEEVQLAVELHGLLSVNCMKNKGLSRGPDVRDGNPDDGGGNPEVPSKRVRDGAHAVLGLASGENKTHRRGELVVPFKLVSCYHLIDFSRLTEYIPLVHKVLHRIDGDLVRR